MFIIIYSPSQTDLEKSRKTAATATTAAATTAAATAAETAAATTTDTSCSIASRNRRGG